MCVSFNSFNSHQRINTVSIWILSLFMFLRLRSEHQQSSQLERLIAPSPSSSVLLVCPLLVRRGTGRPVGSLAGRAGRGGGPRSGPEQSPEPSSPLSWTGPGRNVPPTLSRSAGRSRPEVWASPAGETRGHETGHTDSRIYLQPIEMCLFVFCFSVTIFTGNISAADTRIFSSESL